MKKITIISCVIFLQAFAVNSQIKFFKIFSNNGYDYGQGITQLSDSSYLVTGISSSFSQDPSQVFLMKLDSLGTYQWAKNFGGTESDWGRRVLNFNDSIIFIAGFSNSAGSGSYNCYLVKCDKFGNELLEKQYIHPGWDKVNDALITADSMIYMVGETTGTANGDNNFYIIKTDLNGDTLWTKNLGSVGDDALHSIEQFDDTTFYAVGKTYVLDSLRSKAAVLKFYADGSVDWLNYYGQNGEYTLNDLYFQGPYLYSVGSHTDPVDLDDDEYRLKLFLDGTFNFEEAVHSAGNVYYDQVCEYGSANQIYIGSHYQNVFSAGGSVDAGITRFTDDIAWNALFISVDSPETDVICNMVKTSDGGAVAVGYTSIEGLGGSSVFVLKIGANNDFPVVDLTAVESLVAVKEISQNTHTAKVYPNPTSGNVKIEIPTNTIFTVAVFDVYGNKIATKKENGVIDFDTASWTKGVYFVQITLEDGTSESLKLIVQ